MAWCVKIIITELSTKIWPDCYCSKRKDSHWLQWEINLAPRVYEKSVFFSHACSQCTKLSSWNDLKEMLKIIHWRRMFPLVGSVGMVRMPGNHGGGEEESEGVCLFLLWWVTNILGTLWNHRAARRKYTHPIKTTCSRWLHLEQRVYEEHSAIRHRQWYFEQLFSSAW